MQTKSKESIKHIEEKTHVEQRKNTNMCLNQVKLEGYQVNVYE